MSLRKIRNGEVIAGVAGVALFVALFLPWYGVGDTSQTGWESFAVVDVLLTICAAFGVALLFFVAQQATPAVPLAVAGLGAWAGVVAILLVLIRLIFTPGDGLTREWGLYVALTAAFALFVGCWRSLGDERLRLPSGRWSRPAHGDLGVGVDVSPLQPPPPGQGAREGT